MSTMDNQPADTEAKVGQDGGAKRGRVPYYPLSKAIEVAKIISDNGGNASLVPRSVLAQHLHCSQSSVTLDQMAGSAKSFGLIRGRGAYLLTALAKRYFFPSTKSETAASLLEAVACPTLFEELIGKFDGNRLPEQAMLGNLLQRDYKVSGSWKQRIAGIFNSAMRDVGAIDTEGFLRYAAAVHRAKEAAQQEPSHRGQTPVTDAQGQTPPPLVSEKPTPDIPAKDGNANNQGSRTYVLDLDVTRRCSYTGPIELTQAEFDRFCGWLSFQIIVNKSKEMAK